MRALALTVALMFVSGSVWAADRPVVAQSSERTLQDVQRVLHGHKGGIDALYMRALRAKPELRGQVLLTIAIAPDGRVTKCEVASSTVNDAEFERELVKRVAAIHFGAKGKKVYTNSGLPLTFIAA